MLITVNEYSVIVYHLAHWYNDIFPGYHIWLLVTAFIYLTHISWELLKVLVKFPLEHSFKITTYNLAIIKIKTEKKIKTNYGFAL